MFLMLQILTTKIKKIACHQHRHDSIKLALDAALGRVAGNIASSLWVVKGSSKCTSTEQARCDRPESRMVAPKYTVFTICRHFMPFMVSNILEASQYSHERALIDYRKVRPKSGTAGGLVVIIKACCRHIAQWPGGSSPCSACAGVFCAQRSEGLDPAQGYALRIPDLRPKHRLGCASLPVTCRWNCRINLSILMSVL